MNDATLAPGQVWMWHNSVYFLIEPTTCSDDRVMFWRVIVLDGHIDDDVVVFSRTASGRYLGWTRVA